MKATKLESELATRIFQTHFQDPYAILGSIFSQPA